jgi:hypothetical protein
MQRLTSSLVLFSFPLVDAQETFRVNSVNYPKYLSGKKYSALKCVEPHNLEMATFTDEEGQGSPTGALATGDNKWKSLWREATADIVSANPVISVSVTKAEQAGSMLTR